MPSLSEWAKIIYADKDGRLGGQKSQALAELRRRAAGVGQTFAQYIEPTLTMATGMAGQAVGGLAGIGGLALGAGSGRNVEGAANITKNVADWMTYKPRTAGGQKGLEVVGGIGENIAQRVNTAAGIGSGLATYQATGDIEQAANVGKEVYEKGPSQAGGDYVLDKTGSPLLATGAAMIGPVVDAVAGTKLAGKIPGKQFEMGDISGQAFGQKGIFGGIRAKNADLPAQAKAEEMLNSGSSRDEVWAETGWFKDVDDSWKFEIDDSQMTMAGRDFQAEIANAAKSGDVDLVKKLGDERKSYISPHEETNILTSVIDHTKAFEAYPDAAAIGFSRNSRLNLGDAAYDPVNDRIITSEMNREAVRSPIAHELQHGIQEREGFGAGGNMSQFADTAEKREALKFDLDMKRNDLLSAKRKELRAQQKEGALTKDERIKQSKDFERDLDAKLEQEYESFTDYGQYRLLAGEAEARNVQTRLDMTPEQRRAKPPWQTLDVPENELIVRRGSGVNQSTGGGDYSKLPYKERVEAIKGWESGTPIKLKFARNKESGAGMAPAGMDFGQKIEPAGRYMNVDFSDESFNKKAGDNWEYGEVEFNKPLILEHKNTSSTGWKKDLSDMFGGLTGKRLSNRVKKEGYDGIITRDKYGFNETISLK